MSINDKIYKVNNITCSQKEFEYTLKKYCERENLDLNEAIIRIRAKSKFYHKKASFYIETTNISNKTQPRPRDVYERIV